MHPMRPAGIEGPEPVCRGAHASMELSMIEVVIADDNAVMRSALVTCVDAEPDMHVAGVAENGLEALSMVLREPPDVVLLDVSMPVMDGLAAAREITQRCPQTRVLMLTMFAQGSVVHEALAAGASGYLLKTEHPEKIVEAIRATHQGARPLTATLERRLAPPG